MKEGALHGKLKQEFSLFDSDGKIMIVIIFKQMYNCSLINLFQKSIFTLNVGIEGDNCFGLSSINIKCSKGGYIFYTWNLIEEKAILTQKLY